MKEEEESQPLIDQPHQNDFTAKSEISFK